jgi:hypothetical protein
MTIIYGVEEESVALVLASIALVRTIDTFPQIALTVDANNLSGTLSNHGFGRMI